MTRQDMADADHDTMIQDRAGEARVSDEERARDRMALRHRLLIVLTIVVAAAALGYAIWYLLIGSHRVSTDDAYVGADAAQVTPLVAGAVSDVRVRETQAVKRGQILVVIDDADARIAVAQAEADLLRARRQYEQTSATGGALAATVASRAADIANARAKLSAADADLQRASIDLERRRRLEPSGAVSGDELTSAANAFATARAARDQARADLLRATSTRAAASGDLAANQALVRGTIDTNPDVAAARAKLAQAQLDLTRTVVRAPIDGIVTNRRVQLGQRVAAGTVMMSVVPVEQAYVDANFKEGQLEHVRIGQKARLTSDYYGGGTVYHGRVIGFAGGTGAAFAVIPAQNATGNWIKVVQRLPVRIALDPAELRRRPLRVGLSMKATVYLADH